MPISKADCEASEGSRAGNSRGPLLATSGARLLSLALLSMSMAGCQGIESPLTRWRMAKDGALDRDPTKGDLADDRNLMARWLNPRKGEAYDPSSAAARYFTPDGKPKADPPDPKAEADFKEAETLFQKGRFAEAEKVLAPLAKRKKGSALGEKAQYYLAETQFQRGNYFAAHDSFEVLNKDYRNSVYLEKLVAREFAIGEIWLAESEGTGKPEDRLPWQAHFNGGMPLVDVGGHAMKAFEHVRHNDPRGPLADEAVLRTADHHYKLQDWETAAQYYDELIAEHPKSKHLQRAQLASIDAKIKNYVGPEYDGAGLDQAKHTIKTTMQTFPERKVSTSDELFKTLDLIADAKAERAFVTGTYYKRAGYVSSAEYYFGMIPRRWPKSPWTKKANAELAILAKMPRKQAESSKIMTLPGSNDPFTGGVNSSGLGGLNGPNGMNGP